MGSIAERRGGRFLFHWNFDIPADEANAPNAGVVLHVWWRTAGAPWAFLQSLLSCGRARLAMLLLPFLARGLPCRLAALP